MMPLAVLLALCAGYLGCECLRAYSFGSRMLIAAVAFCAFVMGAYIVQIESHEVAAANSFGAGVLSHAF